MKKKVTEIIYQAINEINEELDQALKLEKSTNTVLMGSNGKLDSLGIVHLLVIIEQNIEDELDEIITIADERAMSQKRSPFLTIETLVDYIVMLLREKNDE
tara:strand:+ start:40 stop:342 length:303 start_codon:yes stop_codon:yes gene_type:complete